MRRFLLSLGAPLFIGALSATAAGVTVTMNTTSPTMTLTDAATGATVDTGEPTTRKYTFDAAPGEYELTAYATDGATVNGRIILNVTDEAEQEFTIFTCTAYATNKNADGTTWQPDTDYTLQLDLSTREGDRITSIPGVSTTAGRLTFLALNGTSYYVALVPNEAHQAEGYMDLFKSGTLTFAVTVSGAIPMGEDYAISLPADAELAIGVKFTHFTDFKYVEPKSTVAEGDMKTVTYRLATGQTYNYRTWIDGGLTQAGYFMMNADAAKRPELAFPAESYKAFAPTAINHSVESNLGYETGDIFVNINPQGYLRLNVGDTFDAHAMRTWELTDNSTNNYFMEPDFHYYVTDLDGNPSDAVIRIDNADTSINPWSTIHAVGEGTAIVRVIYDAIGVNYYGSAGAKTPYLGGEYWGAIWPENTAVYVVSVGGAESAVEPRMLINERYNTGALKLAGEYVDAEHDVFYYLDSEEGAHYSFTPLNAAEVTVARPTIGERIASYSGFTAEGVEKDENGAYTVLLKEGRNIVCLKDAAGNATYQVLTAKPCTIEIEHSDRPGSAIYQPGDKIQVHFSGLRHPANKLAGIYNMSAYVTYNDIPNGTSLILSPNQYTFGSSASAQTVTVDVPADFDTEASPSIDMTDGVIQVNGYGDPIGNHRNISPTAGRSPNFTAIAHKTYFGKLPDVSIPVSARREFEIAVSGLKDDSQLTLSFGGTALTPDAEGLFSGTYGSYALVAKTPGYRCFRETYTIADDAEGLQTFACDLEKASATAWDGVTLDEPAVIDGVYQISTGNELAWFAAHVNEGNYTSEAILTDDIDLAGYDWTPIGGTTLAKSYQGSFNGAGHTVSGLYIGQQTATYQAMFAYSNASISNLTVEGSVAGKQYVAGIAAYLGANASIDRCVSDVTLTATGNYVGGITASTLKGSTVTNCINRGDVLGLKYVAGVVGFANATVENCYNIGSIAGDGVGACLNGNTTTVTAESARNVFCTEEYIFTTGQTLVSEAQMASGEVAYLLGDAFGQVIGVDPYPVIGGAKVYLTDEGHYANTPSGIEEVESDKEWISIFGIDGTPRASLQQGLNIIVYPDGTSRKVMIK